jgi:hypothetical protein
VCAARRSSAVQSRNAVSAPASPQSAQMPEARSITSRRRVCHPSWSAPGWTRLGDGEVAAGRAVVRPGTARGVVMATRALLRRRRRSIRAVPNLSRVCTTQYAAGRRHFPATGIRCDRWRTRSAHRR